MCGLRPKLAIMPQCVELFNYLLNVRKSLYPQENARKEGLEQSKLARLICQKAGVPIDRPGSLNDLQAFEETLRVRIAVVAATLGNKFIRVPGNEREDWPLLYLYLIDHEGISHFHSITNITGFLFYTLLLPQMFETVQYEHKT